MEELALSDYNDKKIYIYVTRAHPSSTATALCLFFNFVLKLNMEFAIINIAVLSDSVKLHLASNWFRR